MTDMLVVGVSLETSGTYLYKGDTTAVIRVHVGMNLKYKSRESILFRIYFPFNSLHRTREWSDTHKAIEQFLYQIGRAHV